MTRRRHTTARPLARFARRARFARLARFARFAPTAALVCLLALAWTHTARAAGGSYATAGTGTYSQSLWWLDLSGYSDSAASLGGSALSFTLPSGAGTMTMTGVKTLGLSVFNPTAEPASTTVGAFGHGAYNGLTGSPILYTTTNLGVSSAVSFNGITVKDSTGVGRSYALYAADGENTSANENLVFGSSATWSIVDTVNYFSGWSGTSPTVTGGGTGTVTETGSGSNSFNTSYVFGTANPTQVTALVTGTQGFLFAIAMPTVTLNVVTLGRSDPSDQFTGTIGYTSPALALKTSTTTSTASTAASGALSVIGTNGITLAASMAAGSASPLSYYSGTIACTNSGPGSTTLPNGTGTSFVVTPKLGDTIVCTLTLTPVQQTLQGTVYSDANHDASLDNGEGGTGLSGLYVKLATSSGSVCQTTATAAAAVNATTGAYSIPAVPTGTYCLTLSNNATLSSTTAYRPPGWVGSEAPTGIRLLNAATIPSPVQNFGLYNGSSVNLVVFGDNGVGSGTANDGVQNGTETGIGNLPVTATVGGTVVAGASTNGTGAALLWLPSTTSGTVTLAAAIPTGYLATGGNAGTTGGTYTRPNVAFTFAAGSVYTGVTFGLVAPNTFAANGSQSTQSGAIVFYPHAYTAGSGGQVTFGTSASATPALAGWSELLYLDTACTGQFASGDTLVTAAITVVAAQRVCLLVKEFVPANAPFNAQNKVTVNAAVVYSGTAAPANAALTLTDVTTVTTSASTQLNKQVQNVTQSGAYATSNTALPGNTLQYQLTILNQGTAPISTIVLNDATPAYTTFVSAACPGTLPSTLTGCTLSAQPTAGSAGPVQWTFAGALAPGTQTTVTFQVTVAQ